ncbi:unannotated protein [freshwater metagenome]|uniref:Unannotated protein n=1 Tax=freshwater metagenome TaxID=449393 RepID=A0A6J7HWL6_9ZZZZ|nr:hypothetical protein [Actinomycetota bacterium]
MHSVLPALLLDPFSDTTDAGRSSAFLVLVSFVVSFLFIRTSARMIRAEVSWWPGNVETESGLHLHHLVWGIALMLLAGFLGFTFEADKPWGQIAAVAFGIGAGLTLDEFALWVHLDDVYWSDEGRISLDAVVLVAAFMALVVVGTRPFGLDEASSVAGTAFIVLQALLLAAVTFLKGRIGLGIVAVFVPLSGLWAACRMAKPDSPWARRFYSEDKQERARRRYPPDRLSVRLRARFFDLIGGRPTAAAEQQS